MQKSGGGDEHQYGTAAMSALLGPGSTDRRGRKWAEDNAQVIIEQARMLGELQEERR